MALNHKGYKEGFYTDIASDTLEKGIDEDVIRAISARRDEPEWMLAFRLNAFKQWQTMTEPHWLKATYPELDYQDYSYYSAPSCSQCNDDNQQDSDNDFLTKEVADAFEQLGVPVHEGSGIAVDAILTRFLWQRHIIKNLASSVLYFVLSVMLLSNILNWFNVI